MVRKVPSRKSKTVARARMARGAGVAKAKSRVKPSHRRVSGGSRRGSMSAQGTLDMMALVNAFEPRPARAISVTGSRKSKKSKKSRKSKKSKKSRKSKKGRAGRR
jgi:hypothetical protein